MVVDINNDAWEMLLPLVAQMASPRGPLDNFGYSALAAAIKRVWDQKEKAATITDVYDLLRTGRLVMRGRWSGIFPGLATALGPYTRTASKVSYFEGEANIEFRKTWSFWNWKSSRPKGSAGRDDAVDDVSHHTGNVPGSVKRKLVIIDEAWDLMGSGSVPTSSRPATGVPEVWRAFGTITQSVDDYYKNEATRAAITNADWLFLLRQKPEASIGWGAKETSRRQWMKRQLSSVSTEHGHYSEVFVHGPMGSGVGRMISIPSRCCCIPRAGTTRLSRR